VSKYLIGAVAAIAIIAALAGAYFLGKGRISVPAVSPTPQATTVTQTTGGDATPTPATVGSKDDFVNPSATIAQIESSVSSKNYQALEAYMASSVDVILYASECCGPSSALQATQQLDYLNSATPPWNFNDNNPIVAQLRAKSDFFKNATVIGTSANSYAVGFTLNAENKISAIALVADYKLITQ